MKTKIGSCEDCSRTGPVIAGRCQSCYWKHRKRVKSNTARGRAETLTEKELKERLTAWYTDKIASRPDRCESCGEPLFISMVINPRAIICHIVEKRHFKEVATDWDNCFYGCNTCHHKYDNGRGAELAILPIIQQRFDQFKHLIKRENWHYLPDYLTL